jgi:hypothetical protein
MAQRRFQIHLSTLLLSVIAAGGLLALHIRPEALRLAGVWETILIERRGFPLEFCCDQYRYGVDGSTAHGTSHYLNPIAVLLNFLLVIAPIVILNEYRIRRRNRDNNRPAAFKLHPVSIVIAVLLIAGCVALNRQSGPIDQSAGGSNGVEWWSSLIVERGFPYSCSTLISGTVRKGRLSIYVGSEKSIELDYPDNTIDFHALDGKIRAEGGCAISVDGSALECVWMCNPGSGIGLHRRAVDSAAATEGPGFQ